MINFRLKMLPKIFLEKYLSKEISKMTYLRSYSISRGNLKNLQGMSVTVNKSEISKVSDSHQTKRSASSCQSQLALDLPHEPVLLNESLRALDIKENGIYLDMTFGSGGHARRILESNSSVIVYGLDRDPSTMKYSEILKEEFPDRFHPLHGKFSDLPELLFKKNIGTNYFNGVLMDLGASSIQFNTPERGFMLSKNGPLDMRMDGTNADETPTASEILAHIDEDSLYSVLKYYGQEKKARKIAKAIVESRLLFTSLKTTKELGDLVMSITGFEKRVDKLQRFSHPATKVFQALRILVNDELNQLDFGIRLAHFFLQPHGTLVAISFHSLEDTILKRHFTGSDLDKTPATIGKGLRRHYISHLRTYTDEELKNETLKPWSSLYKRVVTPSDEEVESNPRARSAKMRCAAKIYSYPY